MEKQLAQVFEFNRGAGNDVTYTPRLISESEFMSQFKLIEEEVEELNQAFRDRDMVGVVDSLVDIDVVLKGMVCKFGVQHECTRGFDEVMENNFTKIYDSEGKNIAKFNSEGKIMKPEGYQSVNLENVFPYLKTIR